MLTKDNLKTLLVGLFFVWVLVFSLDMMFGVSWPSYTVERIFVWTPTVLLGLYWLIFGGDKKKK